MNFIEHHYTSQDGLKLYYREYGDRLSGKTPVLCLPGLTRNSKDFHTIATALSKEGRRVICPDLRGRGRSEYDSNYKNYTPQMEIMDIGALAAVADLHQVVILGTSRGGILAMGLAAARPAFIKASILNDIGPELAPEGIARIMDYVGKMKPPEDWSEAAHLLKEGNGAMFPKLSDDDWMKFAQLTFRDENGVPKSDYDPGIGDNIRENASSSGGDTEMMWSLFKALAQKPILGIRGETSDLLSSNTFSQMADLAHSFTSYIVPNQGHAPFLDDAESIEQIRSFISQNA